MGLGYEPGTIGLIAGAASVIAALALLLTGRAAVRWARRLRPARAKPAGGVRATIEKAHAEVLPVMRFDVFMEHLIGRIGACHDFTSGYFLPEWVDDLIGELARDLGVQPHNAAEVKEALLALPGAWTGKKRTRLDPALSCIRSALQRQGKDPDRPSVYFIPARRIGAATPEPAEGQAPPRPAQAIGRPTGGQRPEPKKSRAYRKLSDVRAAPVAQDVVVAGVERVPVRRAA